MSTGLSLPRRPAEKYEPQKYNERHFSILRLLAMGLKVKDVAAVCGVNPLTVQYTRDSTMGQKVLAEFRRALDEDAINVMREIHGLAPLAVVTVGDVMLNSPKSEVQLRAAQDILDRAGYGVKGNLTIHNHITQEEIDRMKARALATADPDDIVDAEEIEDVEFPDEPLNIEEEDGKGSVSED